MKLSIQLDGQESVAEATDLREWLHRERLAGVTSIRQEESPPAPGEQGPILLSILAIVLGAPATVELVRSIHRWIEAQQRRVRIIIITDAGRTIVVDAQNPPNYEELLEQARRISDEP